MKPEIWSFFSGALGLDLGLEAAGLASTMAVEIDRTFCATIRRNRPELDLIEGDIAKLTGDQLRARRKTDDVLLMAGGPPCQPFSSGGKRAALTDPRGNLIYEYLRLIREVRPRFFILENVANLATAALRHRPIKDRPGQHWSLKRYETDWLSGDGVNAALEPEERTGSALRQLLRDVALIGYSLEFGVLDAADYGAPQHRLRFVMLGSRDGEAPTLPAPQFGSATGRRYRTVGDAIRRFKNPGPGSEYTDEVKRYFALVPPGGNWRSLPRELQPEALGGSWAAGGGKTGFYRRLAWDRPSPTIIGRANRKGSALCHPTETRPLSVRECAALQGFPPDWRFEGAANNQYMQIGNAVPVALATALGQAVRDAIERNSRSRVQRGFDEMFESAVTRLRASARNKRVREAA